MTELNNSVSPFAKAIKEAMGLGEKVQGISFNVLLAMDALETTFDLAWIEKYYRNTGKDRMLMVNAALEELLPEWKDLYETSTQSAKELKAIRNEQRRIALQFQKDEAQAKVKATQNLLRSCVSALVYFRTTEMKQVKLNANKRL